jgi:DNA ligase-1
MKFKDVASILFSIEQTSSRLEITKLLGQLLKQASPEDAKSLSYLVLGTLNPPYISTQFSIAQKTALKVVSRLTGVAEDEIAKSVEKTGDIGSVVEQFSWHTSENLTVHEIFQKLKQLESVEGIGSNEIKITQLSDLLRLLDPLSAKYILRVILGTLRLGFSDMTLIDALSWMEAGDKSLRKELEHAYTICADSGFIAYHLKKGGMQAIRAMHIQVGIPIRPAAAERLENATAIIEKIGPCVVQPKLDGFRLQVHVDMTGTEPIIRFFSRNLLDMSGMFPEFVEICKKFPIKTFIADGEAIVYDPNTGTYLPFQETVKRKRKHGIDEIVSELPLQLNLFDLLYIDGESLLHKHHYTRRVLLEKFYDNYKKSFEALKKPVKNTQLSLFDAALSPQDEQADQVLQTLQIIQEIHVDTAQELETYFLREISAGLEGIVAKKIDSLYQAGKRNFNWIKLKYQAASKLEDSIDVVILGYYPGKGKRASFGIGAFLVGIYNEKLNVFQTVAKIGTGLTDEELVAMKKLCDEHASLSQPKDVVCAKELYPSVWVNPVNVCEVLADEITISPLHTAGKTSGQLGFALRFPRFVRNRPDKSPYQTTTLLEFSNMHKRQS